MLLLRSLGSYYKLRVRSSITFVICAILITILFSSPLITSVDGYGLSTDEAQPQIIGERSITVFVKMVPAFILDNVNVGTIQIRLKDTKTNSTIPYATFLVTVDKQGRTLLSEQLHAHDGEFHLKVKPTDTDNPIFSGTKESLGWVGSKTSPLSVEAPLYLDGGLYHYTIQVLTFETDEKIIEPPLVFDAYVSIGEEVKHPVTGEGARHDFGTRTYFDKINDFRYDDNTNILGFTMPFDWDKQFLAQIPLLHVEVLIPKSVSELMISSFKGTLNGVELPRTALMTDDSNPDLRIVHYMVPGNKLVEIADQAKTSPNASEAVFTLEPRDVPQFPLDTLTNTEKFKIQLSWNPAIIEPGKQVKFIFNIRDPLNDETITNSYYEFVLIKDGREIYRNSKVAVIGAEVEQFTFTETHTGSIIARFENINHTGEFTEYLITVIPEFSTGVLVFLIASAFALTIFATRKYKLSLQKQYYHG